MNATRAIISVLHFLSPLVSGSASNPFMSFGGNLLNFISNYPWEAQSNCFNLLRNGWVGSFRAGAHQEGQIKPILPCVRRGWKLPGQQHSQEPADSRVDYRGSRGNRKLFGLEFPQCLMWIGLKYRLAVSACPVWRRSRGLPGPFWRAVSGDSGRARPTARGWHRDKASLGIPAPGLHAAFRKGSQAVQDQRQHLAAPDVLCG